MKLTDNYEELKKYSVRELAGASLRRLCEKFFEKKPARLATSAVAAFAACYGARKVLLYNWWDYAIQALLFIVLVMSVSVFVSNIGMFKKRKFIVTASISTVLLWIAAAVVGEYTAIDLTHMEVLPGAIGRALLFYVPIFIIIFGMVMLLFTQFTRTKKRS